MRAAAAAAAAVRRIARHGARRQSAHPTPVVSPAWVLDSITAKRALPLQEYYIPEWRAGLESPLALCRPAARGAAEAGAATPRPAPAAARPAAPPHAHAATAGAAVDGIGGGGGGDGRSSGRLDSAHPDFMRRYFEASRLHFIGSFRAHVQKIVWKATRGGGAASAVPSAADGAAAAAASAGGGGAGAMRASPARSSAEPSPLPSHAFVVPPPPSTRGGGGRIVVHIDMDAFFVSVALLSRPELAACPVVVAHSGGGGGGGGAPGGGRGSADISSANYVARARGVRAGMWTAAARELCPDLVVLPYDFARIREVSETAFRLFCKVRLCLCACV